MLQGQPFIFAKGAHVHIDVAHLRSSITGMLIDVTHLPAGIPMDPGLASCHASGLRSDNPDTQSLTSQQWSHSHESLQQHATADSLQPAQAANEQEGKGITATLAEQEAVQKLQQAFAKTQEVGKNAVDQLRSSTNDLQARGKAALGHVQASTPDLAPVGRSLQDFGQGATQQLQAAAAKVQQVGQDSLDQVRSSASDLAKQVNAITTLIGHLQDWVLKSCIWLECIFLG